MEALLEKLEPFYDRKFIFVGDYIDRGPSSKQVVDYLIEFNKKVNCVFLRGNHEQMLLNAFNKDENRVWMMNGGRSTVKSYGWSQNSASLPEAHEEFYNNTVYYYNTEDYFFVHAGISPAKTIEQSLKDEEDIHGFLWERSHLNVFDTPWEKTVVFGHTPRPNPLIKEKMIGIDTGCVYEQIGYGKLTAAKLPEEEFIQQPCLDK